MSRKDDGVDTLGPDQLRHSADASEPAALGIKADDEMTPRCFANGRMVDQFHGLFRRTDHHRAHHVSSAPAGSGAPGNRARAAMTRTPPSSDPDADQQRQRMASGAGPEQAPERQPGPSPAARASDPDSRHSSPRR